MNNENSVAEFRKNLAKQASLKISVLCFAVVMASVFTVLISAEFLCW
jgi:hypothetical protein